MAAPRLEIDLNKIYHNAHTLVKLLSAKGITVTGVTKATLGSPEIAGALLEAGVTGLGDSRIENIKAMRDSKVAGSMTLTRSPMLSQADLVVMNADISFNTELDVIKMLSLAARRLERIHGIVLMVELGDLREGIMPNELINTVRETLCLENIEFKGIAANLACRSGVSPDARNMAELSSFADSIEEVLGITVDIVSGGNSANLRWALSDADTGRINNLRLGESILLGCEPLDRQPINGLHTDAITLFGEVIESKVKPSLPWGEIAQTAFGKKSPPSRDRGSISQTIVAIGMQDTDPGGLLMPAGIDILGASSDHLILESDLRVGEELVFQLNYSAMVRAMTSPFVFKSYSAREVVDN
ncbi:MAG: alanine/ornithine racemase family PLP-dependent enzyme [Nitrospinota bacterium]|nr:alanine/ornithine racemase family PLP-dependent enzyme [Nitrospinota bacterium]